MLNLRLTRPTGIYEHDGFGVLAVIENGQWQFISRNGYRLMGFDAVAKRVLNWCTKSDRRG